MEHPVAAFFTAQFPLYKGQRNYRVQPCNSQDCLPSYRAVAVVSRAPKRGSDRGRPNAEFYQRHCRPVAVRRIGVPGKGDQQLDVLFSFLGIAGHDLAACSMPVEF